MKQRIARALAASLVALSAVSLTGGAAAQPSFPAKPIRVIVPYPAGGVADLFARVVTDAVAKRWSQPLIVEARPGASTNIGTLAVLQAKPDGYTWLLVGPSFTANPSLYKSATWNPVKDFTGVGVAGFAPLVLVANEKLPVKTLRDVAALAKAKPGTISAGTMNGSSGQFILEAFKHASGADFLMAPYGGVPPIVTDLINGSVQISTFPLPVALAQIQTGRIRAIAIASSARSPLLPDVPTFAEAGYPEAALVPWYGFAVPSGTPAAVVRQINEAINEVLKSPELRERLAKLGGDAGQPMTRAAIDQLIQSDFDKYSTLIKRSNIQVN